MKVREAIRLAINNILKEGTTDVDIFQPPFELKLLHEEEVEKKFIDLIEKAINDKSFQSLRVNKIGHVLVPKKEFFDFRKCALIDIADEIKYLSIVLLMAKKIEEKRINKSKRMVFSYRFKPNNGYLFDYQYNFTNFRNHVYKKMRSNKINVVIESDISNFYDRLNLHRLESNLRAIPGIDNELITTLNELLLFWANRDSYGLPIGSNASRILAEAALIEVDNYLISQNVDFCRFVDDYRIFASDAATAQHHLSLLVEKLNREGLFLNTRKTRVKDVSEYCESMEDIKNNSIEVNEVAASISEEDVYKNENEVAMKIRLPKIIRGYSGIIPTKFRKMTFAETQKLYNEDENSLLEKLKASILVDPKDMIKLVKVIIAKDKYNMLIDIPIILRKFPQFLPYITDVLLKYQNQLSQETVEKIKISLAEWFEGENIPEYILVYLIRVFKSGIFEDKSIIFNYFRKLKRNSGDYIGRALLESLNDKLTRGEILEIRDYYVRADIWEKRQILRMINKGLSKGEKRPFFKDVQIHNNDIFVQYIVSDKDKFYKIL